ncbi:MAG: MFS transporter [Promethearchaeota archaeon]
MSEKQSRDKDNFKTRPNFDHSYSGNIKRLERHTLLPINILAFLRAAALTTLGLALPNYFIFDLNQTAFIAGLSSFMYCVPYAFLPFILSKWTDKIGRKNGVILSIIGLNLIFPILLFRVNVIGGLLVRFGEGIATSLFWPVIQAIISDLKQLNLKNEDDSGDNENYIDKKIGKYNFSWNLGGILGFLVGTIVVFTSQNNYVLFFVNEFYTILLIPAVILLKEPHELAHIGPSSLDTLVEPVDPVNPLNLSATNSLSMQTNLSDSSQKYGSEELLEGINNNTKNGKIMLAALPLIIPFLIIILQSTVISGISLLISKKFAILSIASFYTYLLSFFRFSTSTVFTIFIPKFDKNKLRTYLLMFGLLHSLIAFILGISANLIIYAFFTSLLGMTNIFLYNSAFQIMIDKNSVNNTAKFTGIFEAIIGLGFGISPLIIGYLADIDVNMPFNILFVWGTILTLMIFILYRKKD